MSQSTSLIARRPLISYFVLTYLLSWGIGTLFDGTEIIAPDGLFAGGPLVAALLVVSATEGRGGLRELGRRIVLWRVGLRWYGVVFALPVVLLGATTALVPIVGGDALDWSKHPSVVPTVVTFLIFCLLPLGAPVSEEIGWRGLALPRLLVQRSPLAASLILGVIWSMWHLPAVLSDPELRVPVPFFLAVMPLCVLTTWLFLRTKGSVFIAILFHAWYDLVLAGVGDMLPDGNSARLWWALFAVQSVAAVVLIVTRSLTMPRHAPVDAPLVATPL